MNRGLLLAVLLLLFFPTATLADEADRLFQESIPFMEKRDYKSALELLRRAHQIEPDSPAIVFNLGMTANYTGDFELGITAFRQYRELKPDDNRGLTKLIQSYQGAGLDEQAENVIDELRTRWKAGRLANTPMEKERSFAREIFFQENYQVMAFEFFEPNPETREHTWDFCLLNSEGQQDAMIYVMEDKMASEEIVKQTGQTPYFFNIRWAQGGRKLIGMTKRKPTYAETASIVRRVLNNEKVGPLRSELCLAYSSWGRSLNRNGISIVTP